MRDVSQGTQGRAYGTYIAGPWIGAGIRSEGLPPDHASLGLLNPVSSLAAVQGSRPLRPCCRPPAIRRGWRRLRFYRRPSLGSVCADHPVLASHDRVGRSFAR